MNSTMRNSASSADDTPPIANDRGPPIIGRQSASYFLESSNDARTVDTGLLMNLVANALPGKPLPARITLARGKQGGRSIGRWATVEMFDAATLKTCMITEESPRGGLFCRHFSGAEDRSVHVGNQASGDLIRAYNALGLNDMGLERVNLRYKLG